MEVRKVWKNNSGEEVIWGSFMRVGDGERKGNIY